MKNIVSTGLFCCLLLSCKKEVSELPPATQTGANTFGAIVNGKLWAPSGFGIAPTAPILDAYYMPGRSVIIHARNFASSPKESEFEIQLTNVKTPGVYEFREGTGNSAYYVERRFMPTGEWRTNNQHGGSVNITLTDTVNKILSGTFQFKAASVYNESPIEVTEGRFDLKLK
ncbi:MAG TPA: DUF6252 family protein [Chitinophagaceae bacterium]|jgi:hypothetical protein|nr:DUF6252 family protein [Chitinophagaceae bacterium]